MSTNPVIYLHRNETSSKIILLAVNLCNTKINLTFLEDLSEENIQRVKNFSPTRILPLMQAGEFNISGTIPITKYLLSLNQNMYNTLIGDNFNISCSVESWVDLVNFKIRPLESYLIKDGKTTLTEESSKMALVDLDIVMTELNEHLKLRSFLVLHSVTLADLFLAINLQPYFTLVFDEKKKQSFPHLTRLYSYVSKLNLFVDLFENKNNEKK